MIAIQKMHDWKNHGYTLIELLVVMLLIGALASLFIFQFPAGLRRARDATRRSDLKQYQTVLEDYANNTNNTYPVMNVPVPASDFLGASPTLCSLLGRDITAEVDCPADPRDSTTLSCGGQPLVNCTRYWYRTNTNTRYLLWTRLEQPTNTARPYFVICSNGRTGESASTGASGNCPL